jgi:hypothetical protein
MSREYAVHAIETALLAIVVSIQWGCPQTVPPAPVPPVDASDAAPWTPGDASPADACVRACAAMTAICGPQRANCVVEMQHNDVTPYIREPSGKVLTCSDVLAATDRAGMIAIGVTTCGVAP